ncbi:glutathione S-transferase-like protein [Calothrix sp. NIES-4101]|nr:glutathione S-transferase-like protein [Calothrix sp. NIES-4101]
MTDIKIYSSVACPYAHRSRLALLEKGVEFELIEIDLQNKPAGFTDISPYGKVPAITHQDKRVWESAIINEYLDEAFPNPPLLPNNPLDKAQARIWIDFANTRLVPAFSNLLRSPDSETQEEARRDLYKHLDFIENEALAKLSGDGPYWFGENISLVDLSFYPWFERLPALEHFRRFTLTSEFTRLQKWQNAVSQRESVRKIANSKEFYIERYARFTNTKKISNNLSAAGQVTPEELQQAAAKGFRSVLNLRSPNEPGFLEDEQQKAQTAGLEYANVPLIPADGNQNLTEEAIQQIKNLPKPILIHCAAGGRASGIALIATAIEENLTYEQIVHKAAELNISLEQSHLKQFLIEKVSI